MNLKVSYWHYRAHLSLKSSLVVNLIYYEEFIVTWPHEAAVNPHFAVNGVVFNAHRL